MTNLLVLNNEAYHNPWFLDTVKKEGNYEVELVTTQKDYEIKISSGKYDMALLIDLWIPGREATKEEPWKSGLAILKDLKERGLPVLVLSIEPEAVDEQAIALGARVLRKPLLLEKIIGELKQIEPKQIE